MLALYAGLPHPCLWTDAGENLRVAVGDGLINVSNNLHLVLTMFEKEKMQV